MQSKHVMPVMQEGAYIEYPVSVEKLFPEAILPKYAHDDDSGADLFLPSNFVGVTIQPHETITIKLGLRFHIPPYHEIQVRSTSGNASKLGLTILNSPGTIDAGYRGELGAILHNHSLVPIELKAGAKVGQIILCPVVRMRFIEEPVSTETKRSSNGYGSTGVATDV